MSKGEQVLPPSAIRLATIASAIDQDWSVWVRSVDVRKHRGTWGLGVVFVHQNSVEPDHKIATENITARYISGGRLGATEAALAARDGLCERYAAGHCAGPTICHECADLLLQACSYGSVIWG